MKITPERWIIGCVLASALAAVAFTPKAYDDDEINSYRWLSQNHTLENNVWLRQSAIMAHERGLLREYASAVDVQTAERAFGHQGADAAPLAMWFAPDVPENARRTIAMLVERERTERGPWRGHGPVGVLVITDTATAIGRVPLPQQFDRDRAVTTAVIPASSATAGRCVTVIRLRHRGLTGPPAISDDRLPLDGCAFTDAFGKPGPKIAEWLADQRYLFARRLSFAPSIDEKKFMRYAWDEGDVAVRACRGGDDSSCVAQAMQRDNVRNWMFFSMRPDRSLQLPEESWETMGRIGFAEEVILESLERDLGPARFQRMWQSTKTLPEAYRDQTGETLASWERERLTRLYGPYRIGPLPSPASNTLTIGLALLFLATTIRFAERPRAG